MTLFPSFLITTLAHNEYFCISTIQLIAITNTAGAQNGEMQLGFYLCKGNLEVEVICARDICPEEKEEPGNLKNMPPLFTAVNFLTRVSLFSVYSYCKFLAT